MARKYDVTPPVFDSGTTVKTSKRVKARAELVHLLENGAKPAREIFDALAELGVGSRTVEKVKQEMQIVAYRSGKCWFWRLPEHHERKTR